MAEWSKAPDSSSGLRKRAWKRKGQEPLLSEDKYESTNLWLLKLKVDLIMKKVYSSEKSDRYINRHIVSDDRRKFQTIDYLKETFHDERANILSGLSRY
ncbi:unnamed protein product [Brassica oleracea]